MPRWQRLQARIPRCCKFPVKNEERVERVRRAIRGRRPRLAACRSCFVHTESWGTNRNSASIWNSGLLKMAHAQKLIPIEQLLSDSISLLPSPALFRKHRPGRQSCPVRRRLRGSAPRAPCGPFELCTVRLTQPILRARSTPRQEDSAPPVLSPGTSGIVTSHHPTGTGNHGIGSASHPTRP